MSFMRYKPMIEEYQKVGWLSGLIWTSCSAFKQSKSQQQVWYGQSSCQQKVFRTLHDHINKSLGFKEHRLVQLLRHIFLTFAFLGACIVSLAALLCLKNQKYKFLDEIGITVFSAFAIWNKIKGVVNEVYKQALFRKLRLLVKACNEDLEPFGFMVKFPSSKAYFLFCIPLKMCNFADTTVLEIFSLKHEVGFEEQNEKTVSDRMNYEVMI